MHATRGGLNRQKPFSYAVVRYIKALAGARLAAVQVRIAKHAGEDNPTCKGPRWYRVRVG